MPTFFCFILIAALGTLNSSFAISRESMRTTAYRASAQQKKSEGSKRPTPEAIWKGIKAAAQDEVRSNSPLVIAPKFTVKQIGSTRQLTIARGDVGAVGFREDDPYELPFKKQILIESLRLSLAETRLTAANGPAAKEGTSKIAPGMAQAQSYWEPYLMSAENLVRKAVVDIESERNKSRLKQKLHEDENQIDEILYVKLYQAVEQEAEQNGYNVISGRGGSPAKKFSVNISTVPDGGKVWMMTGLIYKKQLILKTDRSQWPWLEVVQNPFGLVGRYHYRAVWPDGKRAEGDIEVNNASPLRVLPN